MLFEISKKKNLILIAIACLIIFPFVYVTRYAVLSADDFSYAVRIRHIAENQTQSYLGVAYALIKEAYLSFSGRWLDHFLLATIYKKGINISIVHIYLILTNILFFISSYLFIKSFCWFAFDTEFSAYMFLLVIGIGLNISSPSEIFYWVCGSVGYTLPFSMSLLSVCFWIKYVKNKKTIYLILSTIFAFLSTGGSLIVSGFVNILLLLLTVYHVYQQLKAKRSFKELVYLIPFFFVFVGACINAFAPGSFQRHEVYSSSGLHIGRCLFFSLKITFQRIQAISCQSYFIAGVIIIFIIIMVNEKCGGVIRFNFSPILTVLSSIIISWVSYFPYILGYYTDGSYGIAHRVLYIIDWITVMGMLFSVFHFIIWYRNKEAKKWTENFGVIYPLCIVLFVSFLAVCTELIGFYQINSIMILSELRKKIIPMVYESELKLFDTIESSNEMDIIVNPLPESKILKGLELYETDHWVNEAVAEYYGKNSLTVQEE